jgi:predicted acylesterase/phospholipase RssA
MTFLLSLWGRAKAWVIAGVSALALLGVVYLKGRSDQKNSNENKELKERLDSIKKSKEVSDEVRKMSPSDLDRELERSGS